MLFCLSSLVVLILKLHQPQHTCQCGMLAVVFTTEGGGFFVDAERIEVLCNWKEAELYNFDCLIGEDVKRECTRNTVTSLHFWLASLHFNSLLIQGHMEE